MLSGCATISPLTQEEKAKIHSLSISSNLGKELQYVQLGTTVFQNHSDRIPGEALLSGVSAGTQKAIESRGYAIVNEERLSDYILVIEGDITNNYPSGQGVKTAGFFVHSAFGLNPGIQAQARIFFQLKDPKTGQIRASASVDRLQFTPVKKAPAKWAELTEEERHLLIEALTAQLLTLPEEGVKKLGL